MPPLSPVPRSVLIVDDHDGWRRLVSTLLRTDTEWTIAGEAVDGLEAIDKADALNPALLLLDVTIPRLNGIDAAHRILARPAPPKILFVSAHGSWDIGEAALVTGAHGYVLKMDAGRQLPRAMEIVAGGGRFVSPRLAGRRFEERQDPPHAPAFHEAVVAHDERSLCERYALFAEAAFNDGDAFVLLVDDARMRQVDRLLRSRGVDVDAARHQGRYVSMDVTEALAACLVEGWPDDRRVWAAATSMIMRAASALRTDSRRVSACGEASPVLLASGRPDAAIRLERLWDDLAAVYNLRVLCGYLAPDEQYDVPFRTLCEIHSAVHLP